MTIQRTLIKDGSGVLYSIKNSSEQPGKTATFRDGETIILLVTLDKVWTHVELDEDGQEVILPGMLIDCAFETNLTVETDGTLDACWYGEEAS